MGYLKIENLYKNQDILLFKECYALEKIHGTSAHISWKKNQGEFHNIGFFSGGVKHELFVKLFDANFLIDAFTTLGIDEVTIYGEAYGGSCQGMSKIYGKELRFVAFDVKIGDCWLDVEKAANFVKEFNLEFVYYVRCCTDLKCLDYWRDYKSVQAVRNGIEEVKKAEGVVLRPIVEVTKNDGKRIIVKHKRADFCETRTPRPVNQDKLKVLAIVKDICIEWVTENRLSNILSSSHQFETLQLSHIPKLIDLMIEDVLEEGEGELVNTPDLRRAISRETALMIKRRVGNG